MLDITSSLQLTPLGAGQEVGRSCIVLQYRDRTVVCDAGIHPGHSGMAALPFLDHLDWSTVDVVLITHFHLDHVGALAYIMEKTNFRQGNGKVYMTHPTKAVYKLVMQDFLGANLSSLGSLFTTAEVAQSLSAITPVAVHQQVSPCPGVSFTPYHAGHVLGACMFMIDILGIKILYTGDYSREEDHHLVKAEIPPVRPDVLVVESTHGGMRNMETRAEKELRFTTLVHATLRRGGHVLLPVFALGTAQELLLILEAYWEDHPDLCSVPIYYTSGLARKCMAVYQTHIHAMNADIRTRFAKRDNPFVFKHISSAPAQRGWVERIARGPPCVVLASPAFMDSGSSRELLEHWVPEPQNGLIITGYSTEGTMAKSLLDEPEEIFSAKGERIPRKISVHNLSFSAHVDYSQNSEFIELVDAEHVLVHGEKAAMGRLRAATEHRYEERGIDRKIYTPGNLDTLEFSFRRKHIAQVIGGLATEVPKDGDILSGLLVTNDRSYILLDAQDLDKLTGLAIPVVTQKQRVVIGNSWELVRWHLEEMFGKVEERVKDELIKAIRVMGVVDVKHTGEHEVTLEWVSSGNSDMVADATLGVLAGIDKSPASVKVMSARVHADADADERNLNMSWFLEAHFSDVDRCGHVLNIRVDGDEARVDLRSSVVTCANEMVRRRVERVVEMASLTVGSLDTYEAQPL